MATTSPPAAALPRPVDLSFDLPFDHVLHALLQRTAGDIAAAPGQAARRAVRRRLTRLSRRRRLSHSLGTGTLAAGLVAGGAHQLWTARLAGTPGPPAPTLPVADGALDPSVPAPVPVPAPGPATSWTWDPTEGIDRVAADPGALYAQGAFHVFTTSAVHCAAGACTEQWVPRFTSPGLDQPGTPAGDAMPTRPAWVRPDDRAIWAPAVARIGDRYVMWFAATAAGTHTKCLGAAVASRPEGPFVPLPRPLRCTPGYWAIDPSPVTDGDHWYLLWRQDDPDHPTGRIVAAELRSGGVALAEPDGEPTTLLVGQYPWEDGGRGIGPIENPAMARHPATGEWLLTWSANRWETQDYATGLAVCTGPLGPCRRISQARPWLRTSADTATPTPRFGGAGGLSFVTGPDGDLYAVFHAYPGTGEHPEAERAAWAYRVEPDPTVADRYRLVA
jgi:GH43 family beta-xylosidase